MDGAKTKAGRSGSGLSLSLVMIARDEEENLPRALASARPWVDEIVLVDTGSRDRTVEIALAQGARVFHHPWEDDFAKHRNQALSYAGGDWCLQLDADEELDRGTAPLLRGLLTDPQVNGYQLEMYNVFSQGVRAPFHWPRLFRNISGVHYYRRVHNQVRIPGTVIPCRVRLYHYGYALDPKSMARKHQRRLQMVTEWVRQEPQDWEARYFLAQTLVSQPGNAERALAEGLAAIDLAHRGGQDPRVLSRAYLPVAQALEELEMDQRAVDHNWQWHCLTPDNPDALLFLGRALERQRRWEDMWRVGERFWQMHLALRQNPAAFAHYELLSGGLAPNFLAGFARAGRALGRLPEVAAVFERNFCLDHTRDEALVALQSLEMVGLGGLARDLASSAARRQPGWNLAQVPRPANRPQPASAA